MPVSATRPASLEAYERAVDLMNGLSAGALGVVDAALADDPDFVFGHLLKAAMVVVTTDRPLEPMLREAVAAAERLAPRANDRERRHLAAARAWLDGEFELAIARYGAIAVDYPRDTVAIQTAHGGDFLLGQQGLLRDRIAQVLHAWDESVPGYGWILGMHAFGLEETGDYRRAEETGRRAVALQPHDAWAAHAVAHVLEMEARLDEGVAWLSAASRGWAADNGFAYHNHWHRALYHLDLGDVPAALAILDERIRPGRSQVAMELVDASALLWRLRLRGVDDGARWAALADDWAGRIDDGYYAFNDVHALMAFLGAGREAEARRLLAAVEAHASDPTTNGRVIREVGLPICRALVAFDRGDHDGCIEALHPVRHAAVRFGGSNAQRDVLSLTLLEAALRGGRAALARALASERVRLRPSSPLGWQLAARAADAAGDAERAAAARTEAERLRARFTGAAAAA
jgi:hypothetical protein